MGAACAAAPTAAPAASNPIGSVIAVPMNISGAVPPVCQLPFSAEGKPCADTGQPVTMTPAQVATLDGVLADPATWGGDEAKCTLPLHGFVWLDDAGRVRQQLAVSLLCDKVEGAPAVPGQPAAPAVRGISEVGATALRALCADAGLPHCHISEPGQAFGR